jgi:hypothetical protein
MASVDEIVARWRASGYYEPRPPRPKAEQERFLREVEARCGFRPADDYVRFLELCDGGQFDACWYFGCAPDTVSHLDTGELFAIGDSGNIDLYVLRPDGRADIVGLAYMDSVFEAFPSFTAMLDKHVRHLKPRRREP